MPDDKSSEGIQQESVQQVASPGTVIPPAPPYNPPSPPAQSVSDSRMEGAIHAVEDRVKRAEWLMIGLTAGIVLLTLGLVIVGILQWRVMSGQLGEMKSSSGQTDQLISKTGTLAENAGKQADRSKDLADRMKDQADRTKTIAEQAVIQANAATVAANAAKSAAQTAISTLHVSERAYVAFGAPQWSMEQKTIDIRIENDGRIPSGKVEVVAHEATVDVPTVDAVSNLATATEKHWQRTIFQTIIPTVPMSIKIPIVKMDSERLKTGLQLVMVVGFISYNDGFDDSPITREPFCVQSLYSVPLKQVLLSPCDPVEYLPRMELVDGYPNNEQSGKPN